MMKENEMSIEQDKKIESSTSILPILKNTLTKATKFLFIALFLLFFNIGSKYPVMSEAKVATVEELSLEYYPIVVRSRLQESLIFEVNEYMQFVAPGNKINAELLISLCKKYDVDIIFVIAQGMLESHLGTKGKAVQTNSVWNVGTYDDGKVLYTYKDPNHSIEPYLILLTERYLGEKKTINDLIRDKSFVNLNGHRYATATNYEAHLRTFMVHINMNTSISMYQDIMKLSDAKILAYFGPIDKELIDSTLITASL